MNSPLYWIVTGATWVSIGVSVYSALRLRQRNKRAWDAYERVVGIADRALDRADWALDGIEITLKWAGVHDIPDDMGRETDPRGSVEESPHNGMGGVPGIQG